MGKQVASRNRCMIQRWAFRIVVSDGLRHATNARPAHCPLSSLMPHAAGGNFSRMLRRWGRWRRSTIFNSTGRYHQQPHPLLPKQRKKHGKKNWEDTYTKHLPMNALITRWRKTETLVGWVLHDAC